MYQTVFISVVSVVLLFELFFLVFALVFTLKYKDQESRRGSDVSTATTTTTEVVDDQNDITEDHKDGFTEQGVGSFEQPSSGAGNVEQMGNIEEQDSPNDEERVERITVNHSLEYDSAGIFNGISVETHDGGLCIENDAAKFDEIIRNLIESNDGKRRQNTSTIGKSIQYSDSKPNVSFFDAVMHTDLSYDSTASYEDSSV